MKVLVVIPARFGSTRFEGKPLLDIAGKSLLRRTYEQALKTGLDQKVVVATDDKRIYDHVKTFGECVMTGTHHYSGTDRCFEVAEKEKESFDVMINLQGDEPFILPAQIELLADSFHDPGTDISTLKKPLKNTEELFNTNIVKVVCRKNNTALFFSRQAIPYCRDDKKEDWVQRFDYFRHVGIYAFRFNIIDELKILSTGEMEKAEKLEQLRWLENGYTIHVSQTEFVSPAIDTPEDIELVNNFLKMNPDLI